MKRLSTFLKKEDGAFAIEYAMTFPLFLILVYGFMEISLYSFSSSSLQRSLEETIYDLRTGHAFKELAEDQDPEDYLKEKICANTYVLGCAESINVSVQKYDVSYNIYEDSADTGEVDLGAASIVMRVQADVAMPNMFTLRSTMDYLGYKPIYGDGEIRVGSGLTFMTEPY